MCPEKGLDKLVEAFIALKKRDEFKNLKLKVGGGCGPGDEPFVEEMCGRLEASGILGDVEFFPNLTRIEKVSFLKSIDVFSVPALYGEAFGLYVIEALAAGVPAVQPRHGAFPELIEATGGGLLYEPENARALADSIAQLFSDPQRARALGEFGQKAVFERFNVERMAKKTADLFAASIGK